jgi:cell shape-determining protein MreD
MLRSTALFVFCLLLLTVAGHVIDDFIPSLTRAFGARVLLVPVIFFACAVTVPFPVMLLFAFVSGALWDARVMVVGDERMVAFGFTILLFAITGALMQGVRPLFRRGRWEFPLLMVGVATVVLLVMEWFLVSFQRGSFAVSSQFWYQVWTSALLCMLVSPLLFFLIFKLAKATGFRIEMMLAMSSKRS